MGPDPASRAVQPLVQDDVEAPALELVAGDQAGDAAPITAPRPVAPVVGVSRLLGKAKLSSNIGTSLGCRPSMGRYIVYEPLGRTHPDRRPAYGRGPALEGVGPRWWGRIRR